MRLLIDTNVLLRAMDTTSPHHAACAESLLVLASKPGTAVVCAQVIIEYWAAATRPKDVNGLGKSLTEVQNDVADIERAFACLPEPPDIAARWQAIAVEHSVVGRQSYDARLVALMQAHGLSRILTLNAGDFARYRVVEVLSPTDVPGGR